MQRTVDNYFRIVTVLAVVGAAYLSASVASQLIARWIWLPKGQAVRAAPERAKATEPQRLQDYQIIQDRNLFNDNPPPPGSAKPDEKPVAALPAAPPAPTFDYQLVGTAVIPTGTPFALFTKGEETIVVRQGREVSPGSLLTEVKKDRVVITQGTEKREILLFAEKAPAKGGARPGAASQPQPQPPAQPAGAPSETIKQLDSTSWALDRKEIDQAVANMSQLITQLRVVPNLVDGQTQGFKVFNIKPGSLFTQIGLQDGDIIKDINGTPLNGLDVAYQAMANLQSQTSIQLNVVRRNQTLTLTYEIR